MSKKIPSQDLNFKFNIPLDGEKETDLQKIKRWISNRRPPLNIILSYLFSYFEKWYWDAKVTQTMEDVDRQVEEIKEQWEKEDDTPDWKRDAVIVEEGVFGEEGWSISISNPIIERRSEESDSGMGISSNETRLEEKIPDPWDDPLM
jgi:hypothetical protein